MQYTSEALRLPISDDEISALYAEHFRIGHDVPVTPYDSECIGCLSLEDLEYANRDARKAQTAGK